jgi:putative addiction module component (TIGR02574 family)
VAADKKIEAIYTMVEEEIEETSDHWEDEEFVAELQRRDDEYKDGRMKTFTLEETISRARQALKE